MVLKFYVKNQTLVYCGKDTVASGSKNYLYADFRFTKEWAGLAKTAVFVSSDGSRRYHMLLEGGRCSVPAEMIAEGGFYISVFGGDRITSTQVYIDVAESGVEPGLTPPEPTEDVYNQIITKVDDIANSLDALYVTEDMIADSAVTAGKIADGAVGAKKLADGTVGAAKIADGAIGIEKLSGELADMLHTHSNKATLDKISSTVWDGLAAMYTDRLNVMLNAYEVNEFRHDSIDSWYDFPFAEGELFEIYNETENNISQLNYNDEVVWKFSEILECEKSYLVRIVSKPVTGADPANGVIEVIKVMPDEVQNVFTMMYGMINEMSVQIKELSAADSVLAALLSEGV